MIVNDAGLESWHKTKAKIVSLALAGDDPVIALTGPIPASKTVLDKADLSIATGYYEGTRLLLSSISMGAELKQIKKNLM